MSQHLLITGGAGFIGVNAARHFLKKGWHVTLFDNFSRKGTTINEEAIRAEYGDRVTVVRGDVRTDSDVILRLMEEHDAVFHFAAQVAVTTSVVDPRNDYENNAFGTFNVLEAVRQSKRQPPVIYSSTNKVYGSLEAYPVTETETRFRFENAEIETHGVSETQNLDFHSPYGCSKGAADQYVIDYSRIYGLKTVVFRQSCIYGEHQFGVEDQGWVAWFSIAAMLGKPITIYGTGKQVRDILFADDLVRLYELALENIDRVSGQAYNIGGGPGNTISLIELMDMLQQTQGYTFHLSHADIRPGDQPIFVADIRKAERDLGWKPEIAVADGVNRLNQWLQTNRTSIERFLA